MNLNCLTASSHKKDIHKWIWYWISFRFFDHWIRTQPILETTTFLCLNQKRHWLQDRLCCQIRSFLLVLELSSIGSIFEFLIIRYARNAPAKKDIDSAAEFISAVPCGAGIGSVLGPLIIGYTRNPSLRQHYFISAGPCGVGFGSVFYSLIIRCTRNPSLKHQPFLNTTSKW